MQTQAQTPVATTAPRVIINGVDRTADVSPGPSSIYEALTNQRDVLGGQLGGLEAQRNDLNAQLQRGIVQGSSRAGVENRIAAVDERITNLEKQISGVDAQIASTAAVPGAVLRSTGNPPQLPDSYRTGPPKESFVLAGLFILGVLLPLSLAITRRIWKRSSSAVAAIPSELMARLSRIEQAVDTSAVEIERIGEGQRFITKLFTESKVPALPSGKNNIS